MYLFYKIRILHSLLIFLCVGILSPVVSNAQSKSRVHATVLDRYANGVKFDNFDLFDIHDKRSSPQLGNYQSLSLKRTILQQLEQMQPDQFQLTIPLKNRMVTLALIKAKILDDSVKFIYADAQGEHVDHSYIPPVFYHGIIKESDTSFVTASVTSDAIHLFISFNKKNIQIGSVNKSTPATDDYGVFENLPGNNDAVPFTCGTNEEQLPPMVHTTRQSPNGVQTYGGHVVRCFFDCAYAFYLQNGAIPETYNRITTLFNEAALLYGNEQINTSISEIRIWTVPDPYNHSNRTIGLSTFKNYVQNNYSGNLAMLCDYTPNLQSGLSDAIGGLCVPYTSGVPGPYIYNDLNYSNYFSNFPVPADAPAAYLMIHEMGHVLGSHHTHWCGWVGGAIDNCAAVEGACTAGPTPVVGTMMSYCCTNPAITVDWNAGFGPQPGNTIRNYINASACVGNGTTVCDSSLYLQGSITNSDYTRFEVSNQITSITNVASNANVIFDAGKSIFLKPGFIANAGAKLRVLIEGCGGIYGPVKIRKLVTDR